MQFLTSLFGGSGNALLTMLFALGAVIVLIVLGVWLLKVVFNASGSVARGRNRRLAVVDTLAVDQKRQLVIIRRDDVEHVILVGGPQDVVVETGIPVAPEPAAEPVRRPFPTSFRRPAAQAKAAQPAARSQPDVDRSEEPQPVVAPKPANAVQQLREMTQGAGQRPARSLRHTGLLRPVSVQEDTLAGQNPDISAAQPSDSAKQSGSEQGMESAAAVDQDTNSANRG
ncbi:MAG: flagellar biosynthetic protein FliO [Devosia sp.]|uniref:FliO/MopB family protein n=1 Tax=Devosia sp. TaxID=1871048 RepID=UPI0024CA1334|nr:flagellar biosynthetic protein FliO [Devosia sp.]UYO00665.1 MAG: flagellar biosynthetic protein FliO [Devosia sp.]